MTMIYKSNTFIYHIILLLVFLLLPKQFKALDCSLQKPIAENENLKNWKVTPNLLITENYIRLVPNGTHIRNQMWCSIPLDTHQLEISITFKINLWIKTQTEPSSNGFALWLLESLPNANDDSSNSFFGFKNMFKGLGVFFANFRTDKNNKSFTPSLTAAYSDGDQVWNELTDIPATGVYWNIRNSTESFTFKLTYTNSSTIIGSGKFPSQSTWTDIFQFHVKQAAPLYFGLSADSGQPTATKFTDLYELYSISVTDPKMTNIRSTETQEHETQNKQDLPLEHIVHEIDSNTNLIEVVKENTNVVLNLMERMKKMETQSSSLLTIFHSIERLLHQVAQSDPRNTAENDKVVIARLAEFEKAIEKHMSHASKAVHSSHELFSSQKENIEQIESIVSWQVKTSWIGFFFFLILVIFIGLFLYRINRSIEKQHLF